MHIKNKSQVSQILAIDFGKAKVGLAMADTETKIAFAYKTISNDKNFWENLTKIIKKENIQKIIVGIPSKFNKTDCMEYEKLGNRLKKELSIEIEYQNEMFTTKMAQKNIKESGVKNIARKDDQEAAKIILQDWLNKL